MSSYAPRADPAKFANADIETTDEPATYHHGVTWRGESYRIPKEQRHFVAWDGEGTYGGVRQNYSVLGCSDREPLVSEALHTTEMLKYIIAAGKANFGAWHVGFAFDYDTNMILRSLTPSQLRVLRDRGSVKVLNYRIEHVPSKWLQITEYGENAAKNKRDKFTVRINDMFGFFQCSFIKACKSYIADHPLMHHMAVIEEGKEQRSEFTYDKIDFILKYFTVELELMRALAQRLKELLYAADLAITRWHGPGALANYAYKKFDIARHKSDCGEDVYDAARYAYAGGRFERFHIGRFVNGFGIDINSAYPYAISRLPSLSEGEWSHTIRPDVNDIVEFGVYRVRMKGSPVTRIPSPLFHRDRAGNISYPWNTEGWYWSPEVNLLRNIPGVEILEGWEYTGWVTRPFSFVTDIYNMRRDAKARGDAVQMAYKLLLNSLYGKMAQRVGWERSGKAPTWHQLEWAGWVTSVTRATLFSVMSRIPYDQLIAVETDGIYTTADPAELGITDSKELGGWEVTPFDEIMYIQSGMYAKREGDKWETKYRGLDAKSLTPDSLRDHLTSLEPMVDEWPTLSGPTTRFVGYRQALWREDMGMGPAKAHMCRWESDTKDLAAGSAGKRVHSPKLCFACRAGNNGITQPHDTIIRSQSLRDPMSTQHDIPWLTKERPEWRDYAEGLAS